MKGFLEDIFLVFLGRVRFSDSTVIGIPWQRRGRERKGVKRHNVLKELKESVFKLWDG